MLEIDGKLVSYAQNREDVTLYGFFGSLREPGFYVDVGANHPIEDSVTKFFSLRGWTGINIEPQKHLYQLLRADRPNDVNLAIGIGLRTGRATIREYKQHGLSTFSKKYQSDYANAVHDDFSNYQEYSVPVRRLKDILTKHVSGKTLHFMKVDVEGLEYQVLASSDWKKFRPWVICIESTGKDTRWRHILEKADYNRQFFDGLNDYYVAAEHPELIEHYIVHVASGVVRNDVAQELAGLRRRSIRRQLSKRLKKNHRQTN